MLSDNLKVKIKVGRLYTARLKLSDSLMMLSSLPSPFTIEEVARVYDVVLPDFPKSARESLVFRQALHRSLENYMVGAVYRPTLKAKIAAVLAGNIDRMERGDPCVQPVSLTVTDYCLAFISNVYPTSTDHRAHYNLTLQVVSGPIAGAEFDFPLRNEAMLSALLWVAGIKGRRKKDEPPRPIHPRFLSGCHLFVKPTDTEGRVFIRDMGTNGTIKSRNRDLHRRRTRGRECPYDFEWECSVCPLGRSQCELSTHPRDAVSGVCVFCGEEEMVDPDVPDSPSFECQQALWYS